MKLNGRTARPACAHLLSVAICSGVLFLFVALTYSQIVLPRYATKHSEKNVQQVINLVVTIVATVIGILFSHCRRLTNEAETKTELRDNELTIPRLHVHFEAAGGSKVAMGLPVIGNRDKGVWRLVAYYFLAMMIFAFLHSVLSVIFVIDTIISENGEQVLVPVPLSIDIPEKWKGKWADTCNVNINNPTCTYDLALHSLASQLVTYQQYSIAGVTFDPPNGTMGLPYYAMKHFRDQVETLPFEDARMRYCLPVLDPYIIKCTEVPINGTTCESVDGKFVKFKSLNVTNYLQDINKTIEIPSGLYKISSPFPESVENFASTKLRIDVQGQGVMVIQQYAPEPYVSMIGAANAYGEKGYASMLHRLLHNGTDPSYDGIALGGTYDFAARCEMTPIEKEDNVGSSWRQVDFTLQNGVLRANVTEERCPNARAAMGSGFVDLTYALEYTGDIISEPDGYSKFFNEHPPLGSGTHIFTNMSRFEAIVNQIYHIVQTAWTESSYEDALLEPEVLNNPITMTNYPHLYVISISWTPTTWIGLVLSLLIALNAWTLAARWVLATRRFGSNEATWNLLRPIELMAYSLAASQDLFHRLDTKEHRRAEMRDMSRIVLREHPTRLTNGAVRKDSMSSAGTPITPTYEAKKDGEPVGPAITVRERGPEPDLERGEATPTT